MRIKTKLVALTFMFVLTAGTASASIIADTPPKERTNELTEEQKARMETLKRRVAEIKAMDRSKLSKAERKDIRQELRDMNKEAKAVAGRGVYLSIGAVIIIILLLILLL
ncbi:MAG: hypothetical protein M3352_01655 [Bacteroidota bacterium]|jgi:uncharacterized membrane protein|nr:hypothetical protein [Bacteroidota bacterium]